jgi:DNA mismatch endonuclease (patch repair protein)
MARQLRRDTKPERAIRSILHREGYRYRVHQRPLPALRREADILFGPAKVAVFVDGCFWHGCPDHATWPAHNADWWEAKIEGNRARDRETDRRLAGCGWSVVRIWEHEDPERAAQRVMAEVDRLRRPSG